jgi:addiction module HigA family antidote
MTDRSPYHYYFATFTDDDVSQPTDTEPRYLRRYTILRGPYGTALDAWGDGFDDTDWESVCVMKWYGASHVGTCYDPFTDDFDDFLLSELDQDALFNAVTRSTKTITVHRPERFPPSEYLAESLRWRGWTIEYLATRAHLHPRVIEEVIYYGRPITPLIAGRLALALDTSPELWLNLQHAYDERNEP